MLSTTTSGGFCNVDRQVVGDETGLPSGGVTHQGNGLGGPSTARSPARAPFGVSYRTMTAELACQPLLACGLALIVLLSGPSVGLADCPGGCVSTMDSTSFTMDETATVHWSVVGKCEGTCNCNGPNNWIWASLGPTGNEYPIFNLRNCVTPCPTPIWTF